MRRLLSTHALDSDLAALVFRIFFGGFMILSHGYGKFSGWQELKSDFAEPFGMPMVLAAGFTVFAEFFCSLLLMLGLLTRLACIPLILVMAVAAFNIHAADTLADREGSMTYLGAFIGILLLGSGKYSVDALIFNNKKH